MDENELRNLENHVRSISELTRDVEPCRDVQGWLHSKGHNYDDIVKEYIYTKWGEIVLNKYSDCAVVMNICTGCKYVFDNIDEAFTYARLEADRYRGIDRMFGQ